jgi:hypothetical protein
MTIQELEEGLSKIGYSIKGRYPNRFIYDNLGKRVEPTLRFWSDRIEFGIKHYGLSVVFYYENCNIQHVEESDAVSIGTEHQFFILYKV